MSIRRSVAVPLDVEGRGPGELACVEANRGRQPAHARLVVIGQQGGVVFDDLSHERHRLLEMRRAAIVLLDRLEQLAPPRPGLVDLHLVDPAQAVVGPDDRDSDPCRLAGHEQLHAVHPGPALLRELDGVKQDEHVAARELVEVAEPGEEVRLVDRDDPLADGPGVLDRLAQPRFPGSLSPARSRV